MNRIAHIDLSPELLLTAYTQGAFPMAAGRDSAEIYWFCPDPRAVLPLAGYHVPRSLKRALRQRWFEIRHDTAFEKVVRGCAEPRDDEEDSWISPRIVTAYCRLHAVGYAHSVECWRGGELVGGLYGVAIGGAFFGESMFRDRGRDDSTNASKVALIQTARHLRARGYTLFDVQYTNAHLEQFGVVEIDRETYLHRLRRAVALDVSWA